MQRSVLSLINYYKILRIPDYSGAPEVRRAYLKMAKEYHPDVNKNQDAEEIFKWVNRANETLSDPLKKKLYDQRLKSGYFLEGLQKHSATKEKRMKATREKREAMAKKSRAAEISKYQRSLQRFPLFARFGLFGLMLIYGMFLWYNYWIVNYADYSVYALMTGMLLTTLGIVFLIETTYKRLRIRQFVLRKVSHYERVSMWMLIVMVAFIPFIVIKISDYRKHYHLKHYEAYALARIIGAHTSVEEVVYTYEVDNKVYEKHTDQIDKVYGFQGRFWLIVRYSEKDPVLSEPVNYTEHAKDLFGLPR